MIQHSPTYPEFARRSSQKNEIFSKNRGLAAFVGASAFAQGSGETRRRGRPQCPDAITGRVAESAKRRSQKFGWCPKENARDKMNSSRAF